MNGEALYEKPGVVYVYPFSLFISTGLFVVWVKLLKKINLIFFKSLDASKAI